MTEDQHVTSNKQPQFNPHIKTFSGKLVGDDRVRVTVILNIGENQPNLAITLYDNSKNELSKMLIISPQVTDTEFTLHIRRPPESLPMELVCEIFLDDEKIIEKFTYEIRD